MAAFIECTSLSFSYDIMGVATISYVVVSDQPTMAAFPDGGKNLNWGGVAFDGYVASISQNQIPNTTWYENSVTIIATTN